jgi:hypothetical protein
MLFASRQMYSDFQRIAFFFEGKREKKNKTKKKMRTTKKKERNKENELQTDLVTFKLGEYKSSTILLMRLVDKRSNPKP